MKTFVIVGKRMFNINQIASVNWAGEELRVWSIDSTECFTFRGEEAKNLWGYLKNFFAVDVTPRANHDKPEVLSKEC